MTAITHEINVYADNGWQAENLPALFDAEFEPADRSVGDPGGWVCEFVSSQIGGLKIDRDALVQILSRAEVGAIETRAAEWLDEHYDGPADLEAA